MEMLCTTRLTIRFLAAKKEEFYRGFFLSSVSGFFETLSFFLLRHVDNESKICTALLNLVIKKSNVSINVTWLG